MIWTVCHITLNGRIGNETLARRAAVGAVRGRAAADPDHARAGKYMVDTPTIGAALSARQAGIKAAYLRLRGLGFFCVISSRVLTGVASIRRASSSSDMDGCSSANFFRGCAVGMDLSIGVSP